MTARNSRAIGSIETQTKFVNILGTFHQDGELIKSPKTSMRAMFSFLCSGADPTRFLGFGERRRVLRIFGSDPDDHVELGRQLSGLAPDERFEGDLEERAEFLRSSIE